jgi:hypothetical protein
MFKMSCADFQSQQFFQLVEATWEGTDGPFEEVEQPQPFWEEVLIASHSCALDMHLRGLRQLKAQEQAPHIWDKTSLRE